MSVPITTTLSHSSNGPSGSFGAYGLALSGISATGLGPAPRNWAPWHLALGQLDREQAAPAEEISDDFATILHEGSGSAHIDRLRAVTEIRLLRGVPRDAVIHPLLGSTAIIANTWVGRPVLHAGAFLHRGGVWGVLGRKGDGKSSTLAALHERGCPIITDDLLVVDGVTALAGPRCLDLRATAAEHFRIGCSLGVVGNRERWRVDLLPVPAEAPLRGWISLEWSADEPSVDWLPFRDRLTRVLQSRALSTAGAGSTWLDLATLPCLAASRPQSWQFLEIFIDQLLGAIEQQDTW